MVARLVLKGAALSIPTGRRRGLLLSLLLNAGLPLLVYLLLRPRVGSDAGALAIGAAVPVAATLAMFGWHRRLDPVGAVAVVAFGIALIVTLLSGGNPLVLKLQDAVVTGPIGLVCLASVAVRRPLHLVVFTLMARHHPQRERAMDDPARRRSATVVTAVLGAMLVAHAVALLILAVAVPTATFLELSRPVGLSIIGAGVAVLLWYRNRRPATAGADDRGAA